MPATDRFLVRAQQIARKIEVTRGVAETLTAAEVKLKPFQSELSRNAEPIRFTNDEVSDDIGQAADFVSAVAGNINYGCSFKTSGTVGTPAAVGVELRACGCQERLVQGITIGAITGGDTIFLAGETYSAAAGAKTGIIEQTISGAGTLRYYILTGTALAAADVVTSGGDSATTSGSNALQSVRYNPRSTLHENATIQAGIKNDAGTASEDRLFRLAGALGNATIKYAALDAVRIGFEFKGATVFAGAGAMLTGYTYETSSPPKWINSTCQINGVGVSPSSVEINFGNTVELEPEPTTIGGTDGFEFARILSREPTITIDPYSIPHAILDDLGLLTAGTEVAFQLTTGTTPNIIEFSCTKAQIRENTAAARTGRETRNITLHVNRSLVTDWDWLLYFR
jgi:hypothetical protein